MLIGREGEIETLQNCCDSGSQSSSQFMEDAEWEKHFLSKSSSAQISHFMQQEFLVETKMSNSMPGTKK